MKISPSVVAPIIYPIYKLWSKTLRIQELGREKLDACVDGGGVLTVCLWHDELFTLMTAKRELPIATLVSQSKDGEYLARVMQKLGLYTVRGSSSRGGSTALHEMVNLMRAKKYHACVAIDGPRGPRHQMKDGVFFMAAKADGMLAPVRVFYEKAWVFKSWDRFQLPKPFSRVRIVYETPYAVEHTGLTKEDLNQEKNILQGKMERMELEHAFK